MTLPSNASMDEFPSNAVSHFTTRLHDPLELNGRWEVSLVEASIPTRWSNIMSSNYIRIKLLTPATKPGDPSREYLQSIPDLPNPKPASPRHWVKEKLPERLYHHPRQLVNALNEVILSMRYKTYHNTLIWEEEIEKKKKYFQYDDDTGTLQRLSSDFEIQLSGKLGLILGIGDGNEEWVVIPKRKSARYIVDLRRGLHHIFVYCDIVQYVAVGDVSAPLLRIIPLANSIDNPEQYTHVFNNPHYIPISRRNIETIQMDLRSDTGEYIPFLSGKAILKLHFRRRRPI